MNEEKAGPDLPWLAARLALEDLAGLYARAIDRRDMALLRMVYHPDAIDEHGIPYQGDVDGFVAAMPDLMSDFEVTQHQIHTKVFAIEGDRADGELYFTAYHRTMAVPRHFIVLGRYLDNYANRDGAWKIARRRVVWDAVIMQDVSSQECEQLKALGEIGAMADDCSYRSLPLLPRMG